MLECSPRCPTVRRQIREQVKRAGWTDEYVQSIIGAHSVDTTQDLKRGLGRKVKPDSRKKPLSHRKRGRQELPKDHPDRYEEERRRDHHDRYEEERRRDHHDRYEEERRREHHDRYEVERRRDHSEPSARDLERAIDYVEAIVDLEEIEEPVASLVQESIYYTEEKQIARVAPLRRVTPKVSPQSVRDVPGKTSRTRTPKAQSVEIGSPIEEEEIIVYGRGEVEDTAVAYHKEVHRKVPVHEIPDREEAVYEEESHDAAYRETHDRKVLDHKVVDHAMPGPSRDMDDKRTVKSRDGSPDSFYKYTPKELSSDWPYDDCDESCPANLLKERAEKLQKKPKQMDDRFSPTGRAYYADICTCSLSCMVHNLRRDPFVRSILTSAMLFAIGLKLCSEMHGWFLPIHA